MKIPVSFFWRMKATVNATGSTNIGMASGAVFSDLDGDGDADLLLACRCALFWNDAVAGSSRSS
jgi:hypothetical protein